MLTGQNVLVTGASSGIGRAAAIELAKENAHVIIHYNHSENGAKETLRLIEAEGGHASIVQADFRDTASIKTMFSEQIDALLKTRTDNKQLDVLINNAGLCERSQLRHFNDELFDKLMAINLRAPMYVLRESLKRMNDGGRIVNMSSMMKKDPDPKYLIYGAAKAGLDVVSKALVKKLGKRNIRINSITPGFIPTNIQEGFSHPMVLDFVKNRTTLGRVGNVEDVAKVVLFLVSPASGWITGETIEVSGGFL